MLPSLRQLVFLALVLALAVQTPPRPVLRPDQERSFPSGGVGDCGGVVFRSGDIVFRRGQSMISRAVLAVDPESGYSHTGLIRRSEGQTWVIHATTGDPHTRQAPLRVDTLGQFLGPYRAALYRPSDDLEETGRRAAKIAYGYALEGRTFDPHFDLETEDELYCTELVWKAYLQAGFDLVDGELDDIRLPMFRKRCLLPSRLLGSSYLRLVCNFKRKET